MQSQLPAVSFQRYPIWDFHIENVIFSDFFSVIAVYAFLHAAVQIFFQKIKIAAKELKKSQNSIFCVFEAHQNIF